MNRTERLQEVLRLEGIATAALNRAQEHRAAFDLAARTELEEEGSAPSWRVSDLGIITLPVSKQTPFVDNAITFLAWVKDRYPEKVEKLERVSAAFQAALLAKAFIEEGGVVDGATGEVIPGVSVRPGGVPKSLSITPTPEARAVFDAIGERLLDDLLADPEPVGHLEPSEVSA
jgi:hypothetical protein